MDNQFYPTPNKLANKMWSKFENTNFRDAHILEPSAGRGDLLCYLTNQRPYKYSSFNIDTCEIDFDNQSILRDKELNVVGHDFFDISGKAFYTHIIMNPPFKHGAQHLIHAYNIMRGGEIVALVNAETIKNPCDKYRVQLARIIEDNDASVEFVEDEFLEPDTKRKTSVECAIIHIKKIVDNTDIAFLDKLAPELNHGKTFNKSNESLNTQLALKQDTVKQAVNIFNAAVIALDNEVRVKYELFRTTDYYYGLLADSLLDRDKPKKTHSESSKHTIEKQNEEYNQRYNKLKEKAWSHILTATKVCQDLSRKVRESLISRFSEVSQLEFTAHNIYGFLEGLINQRSQMNIEMLCEVFDGFTRYHSENRVHYKGWKSNDKHKLNAYRIKMTRFIMPIRDSHYSWTNSLGYGNLEKLKEWDNVFCLLDNKDSSTIYGLADLGQDKNKWTDFVTSQRMETKYFDVRYYPGAGTLHFFPKNKKIIDKLNRLVGAHRQWLPPEDVKVSDAFWLQYDNAEKIQAKLDKMSEYQERKRWLNDEESNKAAIAALIIKAGESAGLQMENLLECQPKPKQTPAPYNQSRPKINKPKLKRKSIDIKQLDLSIEKLQQEFQLN